MATFHESNFGRFANYFDADLDGFVYMTAAEVLAGRWEVELNVNEALAADIARNNVRGLDRMEKTLSRFHETGDYF